MKLMGHRGARNEAPENTLKGFRHALDYGIEVIELDIHLSSDGHLMVIHDDTLERTTNGSGKINDFTCAQLQLLDAGDGEKIPTLPEALALLLNANCEIQIEVKDGKTLSPLIEYILTLEAAMQSLLTVISFHHGWLKNFKEKLPRIKTTALLYGHVMDPAGLAKACLADGLSFNIAFIDQRICDAVKEENLTLTGWNANNIEDFQRMKELGIDFLGTDCPKEALSWA